MESDIYYAKHRTARLSERKAKLLIDLVRGMPCDQAVEVLNFTHKRAAFFVKRVLQSAMANANEAEATMSRLVVAEAMVGRGPIIKRFQPKDRGRAHPIHKRTCHITIGVAEK